jgi:hypothetical protein
MRRNITLIVVLLACAGLALARDSPAIGTIADIVGMENCYLIADSTKARERLVKELKKQAPRRKIVGSPDEAQFFLEYKVLRIDSSEDATAPVTYSEMTAYTVKDKQRVIAWSKKQDNEGPSRSNEVNLVRNFVKALKKPSASR